MRVAGYQKRKMRKQQRKKESIMDNTYVVKDGKVVSMHQPTDNTPRYYQPAAPLGVVQTNNDCNGFRPRSNAPSIEAIGNLINRIQITPYALEKMRTLVGRCRYEIGWLGTVIECGNTAVIDDIYLFEQKVTAASAEIDDRMLAEFATDMINRTDIDGVEIMNRMCFWGHSHVNMGVSPSGQDDRQMELFASSGHPYMIRGIANKHGEMKFDIFHYDRGLALIDVPWQQYIERDADIEAELAIDIAEMVKYQSYTPPVGGVYGGGGYYGNQYGGQRSVSPATGIHGMTEEELADWVNNGCL